MNSDKQAIFLMGPTASGKTALAMELYQRELCEIISVDSALIYRQMDIGTAKPSIQEQARAPHYLIDILDPAQSYSAADFRQDAMGLMERIHSRGKIPLLVGGTMMYFKVLLEGISPLPSADPAVREKITQQAAQSGWQALHEELRLIDPVAADRIHPNDPQRLGRALEVYRITGKSLTELTRAQGDSLDYRVHQFAIAPKDRSVLHQRIEQRFELMMQSGFEQEVRRLYMRGDLDPSMPSVRCVGYRQMWDYLDGKLSRDEAIYRGIVATRQLAKRQMTWLRSWPDVNWLASDDPQNLDKVLAAIS